MEAAITAADRCGLASAKESPGRAERLLPTTDLAFNFAQNPPVSAAACPLPSLTSFADPGDTLDLGVCSRKHFRDLSQIIRHTPLRTSPALNTESLNSVFLSFRLSRETDFPSPLGIVPLLEALKDCFPPFSHSTLRAKRNSGHRTIWLAVITEFLISVSMAYLLTGYRTLLL